MIQEHDIVALTRALPKLGLKPGDVGAVVHVHGHGAAFEVEFMTLAGETLDVVTLPLDSVRAVSADEVPHARSSAAE